MPKKSVLPRGKWPVSLLIFVLGFSLGYHSYEYSHQAPITASQEEVAFDIRFSPHGGCIDLILDTLGKAKNHIHIHTYSFTSKEITQALIAAHLRGVRVLVVADERESKDRYCRLGELLKVGIEVRIDKVSGLAHNKVMIIDDNWIITGSYNWSRSAEKRNAENIIRIQHEEVNACYERNFWTRFNAGKPLSNKKRY